MKKKFLFTALTAIALLTACSDNASSGNPADPTAQTPTTDSTQVENQQPVQDTTARDTASTNPAEIKDTVANPDTGDTTVTVVDTLTKDTNSQVTPDTTTNKTDSSNTGCANPTPVEFPLNKFIDVGEVYKSIQCNEKVVFIIRHAERKSRISKETPLTDDGIIESRVMGQKLAGPDSFVFYHSGFVRTYQTVENIAIGRGQAQLLEDSTTVVNFTADTIPELADGWFIKDDSLKSAVLSADTTIENANELYTVWIYEDKYNEVFYDLEERSNELLNNYIIKDYEQMPKYTVMASHDQLLMPLTAYATQKKIDLKLYDINSRRWINYLAGVAVIINDKNEVRYVAVKGGETGTTRD